MCNYKVGDQDYFDNRPGLIRKKEETESSQLTTSIPALHNSSMRPGQVRQTASPTLSSHTLAFAFSSAPPSLSSSCWCVYMCVCVICVLIYMNICVLTRMCVCKCECVCVQH